ncbi:MAG: aryl-sulfate sulfotransferase [Gammaproteobacteria bacterium]|nr:aryl-sulfate sulfotransferase [Gammaproteobacteria bacterium]
MKNCFFFLLVIAQLLISHSSDSAEVFLNDNYINFKVYEPDLLSSGNFLITQQGSNEILEVNNQGNVDRLYLLKGALWLARPTHKGTIMGIISPNNDLEDPLDQTLYEIWPKGNGYTFSPVKAKKNIVEYLQGFGKVLTVHHDAMPTKWGTYITLAKVQVKFNGENSNKDFIVEIDKDLNVTWHFDIAEQLIGQPPINLGDRYENWIHSNSLDIDSDDNIVLSARNLHQAVVIDYPSKKVLKRFGDDYLDEQHHVSVLDNGDFLAFNNGWLAKHTRITRFDSNGSLIFDKKLYDENNQPIYSGAYGSVQEMVNGNYVVCAGTTGKIYEFNSDFSKVLLKITLKNKNYVHWDKWGSPYQTSCYRVYKK